MQLIKLFINKLINPKERRDVEQAMKGLFISWTCVNKCTVEKSTEKLKGPPLAGNN